MSEAGGTGLTNGLARLGTRCWDHPWRVLAVWALVVALAALAASALPSRLLSGSGRIEGSPSGMVEEAIAEDFTALESQSLLFVFRDPAMEAVEAQALRDRVAARLESVGTVVSAEPLAAAMRDPEIPLQERLLVVTLSSRDTLASEQEVPRLRAAIAPLLARESDAHPSLDWALTGPAALTHDINVFSARDSGRAELRALPVTFLVLLAAFGSIMAAFVPLLLAVAARTAALGLLFLIAGTTEMSNLVLGIVTMLTLALGIDYSLFLLDRHARHEDEGTPPREAMTRALQEVGPALLFSGVTVAIGLAGLLLTPLMQTRSIGLGGGVAVLFAILAALTLVPALRALVPSSLFRWSPWRRQDTRRRARWRRWAEAILARPLLAGAASLLLVAMLALPAQRMTLGVPDETLLPQELDYVRGLAMLDEMGLKGLAAPVSVLVTDTGGGPVITRERLSRYAAFVEMIDRHPASGLVLAPDFAAALRPTPFPIPANGLLISADETRFVIRIVPDGAVGIAGLQDFATDLAGTDLGKGVSVVVGGQAQYYNDFDRSVRASYSAVAMLVMGLTALALLLLFRAPFVTLKAIVLNLLSVAAGFGAVVLVFQMGVGASLFGVSALAAVPATIPLMIFALLFGVSMDYEIFLLSRVRSHYLASGEAGSSLVEGMVDTGAVISSAALVMVCVFGAFAFAEMVVVQMLGLGLAVAVLVDAFLIRTLLGPALMVLAGRWNWWPLDPAERSAG